METLLFILFAIVFVGGFIGMYFVKDHRNGIKYKGFVGYIQRLIAH